VRLEQQAAQAIQRVWRGRRAAAKVIDQLLEELGVPRNPNAVEEVIRTSRALLVVTWKGVGGYRKKEKTLEIVKWSFLVVTASDGKHYGLLGMSSAADIHKITAPSRSIGGTHSFVEPSTILHDRTCASL
jgi:hypothetical protein